MSANKAAVLPTKQSRPFIISSLPIPVPGPREVLIRVHAAAINPADGIVQATGILWDNYPLVLGCDVAGTVVSVGSEIPGRFQEGDRVMACVEQGGFQMYCVADAKLVLRLPREVGYAEGCVVPLGCVTAMMGCFHPESIGLDMPDLEGNKDNGKVVVIWGASSSVGSCAVQMVKAAGYEIIATAGAHNIEYSKDLGASHVFDHRSETVVEDIISHINKSGKAFAGIFCAATFHADILAKCGIIAGRMGVDERTRTVATVMAPGTPFDLSLLPEGVKLDYCAGLADIIPESRLGKVLGYPAVRPNGVAEEIWGRGKWLERALEKGIMKCKPDAEVVGKGLEWVQEACDRVAKGVSATKLVVEIP